MRSRFLMHLLAAIVVAVALWAAEAAVRAFALHLGPFADQLLHPSPEALLAGAPLVALGVVVLLWIRGVTIVRLAHNETLDERRRLCELYDYTTDAIVILDREMRIVLMNKAAERIGGKRLTESVGWQCHRIIMGSEEPCRGCGADEAFRTGVAVTATKHETTQSGQENWLEQHWYPVTDERGEVTSVVEVARDITDRKLVEREVAALHKMLDARRSA